jgi:hypothetical protein
MTSAGVSGPSLTLGALKPGTQGVWKQAPDGLHLFPEHRYQDSVLPLCQKKHPPGKTLFFSKMDPHNHLRRWH